MTYTLGEVAERLGAEVKGEAATVISSVATLQSAGKGQIAFLANSRYRKYLSTTAASAVVLRQDDAAACETNALITPNPYLLYARIVALLNLEQALRAGIHSTAVVAEGSRVAATAEVGAHAVIEAGAVIGENAYIGPGCVVGRGAEIGADSRLVANVTLYHGVRLGCRVLVHAGAVIGSDGFGFANDRGNWVKVPQIGAVRIGDDVEIGANTTIDRGALEDTWIGDGVKLDNQVQVAHNVRIGRGTAIAGCVGIAGSTQIGERCQIGGGVGIVGHLTIVDDVHLTAMSLVTGNINRPGLYSSGTALEPNKEWQKNAARFKRLDDIARRLKILEKDQGN